MASSSRPSSSLSSMNNPRNNKYDVFLSFREEETRDSFNSHLYSALCETNIETFIDDQLVRGNEISQSLLDAIEASSISVIVFSEGYASSRWCLDELLKILDCRKEYAQIVIPVFYRVDPSHVRKQIGSFGVSISELEKRFPDKKQSWGSALTEAANLSGFDSHVFSRHAFKQNCPPEVGYKELSEVVINYAQGVPLALEILGCYLFGREKEVWESAINKLKRIPNVEIQNVLKGTKKVEGICFDMSRIKEIYLHPDTFTKMCKLRFLKFYNSKDDGENKCKVSYLVGPGFAEVRYLHWYGYPLKSLPSNIHPEKLVSIEMPHGNIQQLWDDVEHNGKLKQIISRACNFFTKSPNHSLTLHLDKLVNLNLNNCKSLRILPAGIFRLEFLKELDLWGCSKLKTLPEISSSGNIEVMYLNGTAIEELPSSIECLSRLSALYLDNCKRLKSLPSSLCKLNSLNFIYLRWCSSLKSLPDELGNLEALDSLIAEGTAIREVPLSIVDATDLLVMASFLVKAD
ncbi:hypothetical protein WN943_015445 [Citrus x changshan-huyou]